MKKARSRKKAVKPVPAGYHTVTPYLACGDGAAAIKTAMRSPRAHTEDLSMAELKKRAAKKMQPTS